MELTTSHIATPKRRPTLRPSKRKLPGCGVAIPSNPSIGAIESEIGSMISSGRFTLGDECAPYTITKYKMVNGVMTPHELQIQGRKVPLIELRQKLLSKQLKYMRLTPQSTIDTMTMPELTNMLNMKHDGKSVEELRELLSKAQKSRSLCMWHDHATMLKMGFVMVTVHVLYDSVVFYTDEEYEQLNPGVKVNIQAEVEQPEIHLLACGSSSAEDQAALIGDRVTCLRELSIPVKTDTGIEVTDTLRFFTGDHPATQFEQGTKQGGTYKCGVCGCQEYLFDDQAHTLQHKWRTPQQLQTLAISGRFGKQAGVLRPLDLKVKELRMELEARRINFEKGDTRPALQNLLDRKLKGVLRVPALLLENPTEELASLNLDKYEIVASEPLHDIKGHLINLISEMPNIIPPGETKAKCTHLIDSCLAKEKKSGADMRRVAIQLLMLLKDTDCSPKILLLLHTIVKIGEIAYSRDDKRCPRQLLQLHNMCWIHMELCRDLFSTPKTMSKTKMFGHYVHALTAHLPTQLELACLRSLNAESEERLFGQARTIAESCTNHHPDNVIPQIMLRLQAKQEQHEVLASVSKGDSQVSHVAKDLPPLPGTIVTSSFIRKREDSWQIHLQQISPFLVAGVGVWWSYTSNGFVFHDGDTDPANSSDAFLLMHHRYHTVEDVEHRRDGCWKRIVDEKTVIPALSIKLYNDAGERTGRLLYGDHTVTLESTSTDPLDISEPEAFHQETPVTPTSEVPVTLADVQSTENEGGADSSSVEHQESEASVVNTGPNSSCMNLNLEECNEGLKSTVGNYIKRLLGCDDDLVKFDDLRFRLKEAKQAGNHLHMKTSISAYRDLVSNFKAKISLVLSECRAKIKELEQKHFQQNGKLPAKTRGSHYYNLRWPRGAIAYFQTAYFHISKLHRPISIIPNCIFLYFQTA